ncbi:uncharacterized protein LOC130552264 [Triplophysa rosa]|uniref:Uncharacterized protein n=1 Tax=Triplophysa rosa TaxID=992332 RepID=A0A9W7WZS9_TRIRA|nr:uncharacterized protein LOC130552264 [Triplophysa rosa]KAI7811802.1 hypothetical protein IRJ41_018903 [Triplophysa rosa]
MPGGCRFNELWLENEKYKLWLTRGPNPRVASCKVCRKDLKLFSMGEAALSSHVKGKKHQELMRRLQHSSPAFEDFFLQTSNASSSSVKGTSILESTSEVSTGFAPLTFPGSSYESTSYCIESFVNSNPALKAEICWAIKVASSHYSYKACENAGAIFQAMFPDSDIAKQFTCGEEKVAYLTVFGIAPYFSSLMKTSAKNESGYVLLFDECLNQEMEKCQLDVHLRFWNDNQVTSRYLTSFFTSHRTEESIYEKVEAVCCDIGFQNLIQLSTDGSDVNGKLLTMAQQNIEEQTGKKMLNVGSFGLHVLHNSFRAGCASANWELENALSSLSWLFEDVPARMEDYVLVTGSTSFPLDFCNDRWLENVEVVERALQIWPSLKMYISAAEEQTATEPSTQSFISAKMIVQDDLFPAKLNFFLTVAGEITPFFKLYQTDKPMLPFMSCDLTNMLRNLMEKFIKLSVMKNATTTLKLLEVDYADPVNHVDVAKLRVGFVTEQVLEENLKKNPDAERLRLEFKQNCKVFLLKMVSILLEKSLLKNLLGRSLSVLDPRGLLESKEQSVQKFKTVLRLLVEAGRIEEKCCDEVLREFARFYDRILMLTPDAFRNFDPESGRLDEFYHERLSYNAEFCHLWEVVKLVLIVSHGQALSVEREIQVNKEVMEENLQEHLLIARQVIRDHVRSVGGLLNVTYTEQLLLSASTAKHKYHTHLDEQRCLKQDEQKTLKRKGLIDEITEIQAQKKKMEEDIKVLLESADETAEKAESQGELGLISKSNGFRRAAKEMERSLETLEKQLTDKLNEMKDPPYKEEPV